MISNLKLFQDASIKNKLFWLFLISNLIVLLVIAVLVIGNQYWQARKWLEEDLQVQANIIGENSSPALVFNDARGAREILSALHGSADVVQAALYTADDTLFASYRRNQQGFGAADPLAPGHGKEGYAYSTRTVEVMRPIFQEGRKVGSIFIKVSLDNLYLNLMRSFLAVVLASLLALFISLAILARLRRNITQPISRLADLMQDISTGKNYSLRSSDLRKDEIGVLASGFNQMLEKIEAHDKLMKKMAHYDNVTELPNRHYFIERLEAALANARLAGTHVGILFVDLDNFKVVNDTLGHYTGDILLKTVGARLASLLRGEDVVCRIGGDEFAIILQEVPSHAQAIVVAGKILHQLAQAIPLNDSEIYIGASIGISLFPDDALDISALLSCADVAMYYAKSRGKNNYQLFQPDMEGKALKRLALETAIRKALEIKQFVLHYQPQVELSSGKVMGVEALLRWPHPELGSVGPADFIPVAEDSGLIIPLGEWVFRAACRQAKEWMDGGLPMRVAVNISGRQFAEDNFVTKILKIIEEVGVLPQLIELELTEGILMDSKEHSIVKLHALKDAGVFLSLDDFGTGYSSMTYLKRFPIHTLKIDQSFVRELPQNRDDIAITKAILALAQSLEVNVVAEGVETRQQMEFLQDNHCKHAQGYYFSKAVSAAEVFAMFQDGFNTK